MVNITKPQHCVVLGLLILRIHQDATVQLLAEANELMLEMNLLRK